MEATTCSVCGEVVFSNIHSELCPKCVLLSFKMFSDAAIALRKYKSKKGGKENGT